MVVRGRSRVGMGMRRSRRRRANGRMKRGRSRIRSRAMRGGRTLDRTLGVLTSPFSAYRTPKIPDGSVTESHGRQFKGSKIISADTDYTIDVLLYPGLSSGCLWRINGKSQTEAYVAAREGIFINTTHGQIEAVLPATGVDTVQSYSLSDSIAKWRMVSGAIRFTDLTADNSVKGWFESIVVNKQLADQDTLIQRTDSGVLQPSTANSLVVVPALSFLPTSSQLTNDPSYQTGSFRDLNSMIFHLKSADNHRSFVMPTKSSGFTTNLPTNGYAAPIKFNANSPNGLTETLFDPCYCYTLVRLYMPAGSRLLLEHVSNQEIIYAETSTLNTFMTKSYSNPRFASKRRLVDGVNPGQLVSKRSRTNT